jgi:hypothetical protein
MVFFPEQATDNQLLDWATRLKKVMVKHKKGCGPINLRGWMTTLDKLRQHQTPEEIDTVLAWYEKHAGEEFIPSAWTAENFRVKFLQIKLAMETADDACQDQITDDDKVVAERVKDSYEWPVEIASQLPLLVHKTRVRWAGFVQKCRDYVYQPRLPSQLETGKRQRFLEDVVLQHQWVFIGNWFGLMSLKFGGKEHYLYNVSTLAFSPASKWFNSHFWQHWAEAWCHNPHEFDGLLGELTQGEK